MRIARLGLLLGLACAAMPAVAQTGPDFSGVWRNYVDPAQPQRPRGSAPPAIAVPLKPEAQAKVDEYKKLVSPKGETPGGACVGTGMPGSMMGSGGYPMEILQRPEQINIVYEAHNEIRRVYLGKAIAEEDRLPARNGYSVGRWDGDKLIVTTSSLKDAVDQNYPHSENARLTEEYSLSPDGKVLTARLTIEDPDWYTQTYTAEKKWTRDPVGWLMPYECTEPAWEEHLEELRAASTATAAR